MVILASPPAETARQPWSVRLERRVGGDRAAQLVDLTIAIGCFALFTGPVLLGASERHGSPLTQAGFGVLAAAPLAVRRRWPEAVLAWITVVLVAAALLGVSFTPFVSDAGPALPIAVYTVAVCRRPRRSLPVTVAAAVTASAGAVVALTVHPDIDQDAVQLLLAVLAWLLGDATRGRREYRRQAREHARRADDEEQRRRRAEDRLQLSREVHDVVSHGLSAIAVQAGIARMMFDEQPAQARRALAAIEAASRSALTDLRRLLRDIREPNIGGAVSGLADLPALAARISNDGVVAVTVVDEGTPRIYPPAVELSGYRIVQEAVTNAVKHAPGADVRVHLAHRPTELILTVTDDGGGRPKVPAVGAGVGLAGIRERVELLGGDVTVGAEPNDGFTVRARIPFDAAEPA